MLTDHRIKLFDLHFTSHGALVLGGGVVVSGTSRGHEFDFVSHGFVSLDLFAALSQIGKNCINTFFVNNAHAI